MSFEGYYRVLTEKGHLDSFDCMAHSGSIKNYRMVEYPNEKIVWCNLVDETNGSFEDGKRIDGYIELEIDKPAVTKKCECCGHVKEVEEETYKIPPRGVGVHIEGE